MSANLQLLRTAGLRYARLEGWFVDVAANRIQRGSAEVRLTPKAMAVLRELIQRQGSVVRRDDLLGIVWRDGFPTDDVLTHAVTELRRALDDDPRAPRIIETIPKVGYRLVPAVEVLAAPPDTAAASRAPAPIDRPRTPVALYAALALLAFATIAVPVTRALRARLVPDPLRGGPLVVADELASTPFAVTADETPEFFPSLSPDGSTVAYAALSPEHGVTRIMVKSMEAAAVPVALTSGGEGRDDYPAWSPDGKHLAFLRYAGGACAIQVMPALGGAARRIADCAPTTVDYIDWTVEGDALLLTRRSSDASSAPATVHRLELATGALVPLRYAPLPEGEDDLQPRMSPDGRWIAFRRGAVPYSDVWVMPAGGGRARSVTRLKATIRGFAWLSDARTLVISSDHEGEQALYRVALTGGEPQALGPVEAYFPAGARRTPVVVYQQEQSLTQLAEYRLDAPDGVPTVRMIAPSSRSDWAPSLSPSGRRVAFLSRRSGDTQLWIHDFASGQTFPVTRLARMALGTPQWSPDERELLIVARGADVSRLLRIDVGSGRVETLGGEHERIRFASHARDGAHLWYSSDASGRWQIWRMARDGSGARQFSREGGFDPRDWLGDGFVYYTKETARGLFRLDPETGAEQRVSWMAGFWNLESLHLVGAHLYFLEPAQSQGEDAWIARTPLSPAGMTTPTEAPVEPVYRLGFRELGRSVTLSPALDRAVATAVVRNESDLMALSLAQPAAVAR